MSREDLQRKMQSSSYPKEPTSPYSKRSEFYSADKVENKLVRKKLQQKNLIEKVLQKITTSEESSWKFISFEEKRIIAGFKARLEWLNPRRDIRSLFKFSFASCYFNQTGAIFEGDLIIQVQQLTFQTSNADKHEFIDSIDSILHSQLQASKKRGFSNQMGRQNEYLRGILIQLGFLLMKLSDSRKKIAVEKIDKKFTNYKLILYPAPATFTWNPLGNICITENKFPIIKRPLIGEPSAIKKYFEASKQENSDYGGQADAEEVELSLEKEGKMPVFNWHIEEQIDLLIFNQQNNKSWDYFSFKNRSSDIEAQMKKEQQKGGQDSIDLGSLSVLPPKLRKAYERYFGGGERAGQLHRHDKLKVYDILSLSRQDQDDIIYLIDRITTRPSGKSVAQIAFQNYFTAYPSILATTLDRFRYQIISTQLRQAITIPKLAFGAYLRAFVLENQFLSKELETYFQQQYRMMRMQAHQEIYGLGSHSKFDSTRAELIFMDLLSRYLQRYDQKETRVRGIDGMRITRKTRLCRFNVQGVVGEQLKNAFLMGLFPLIIVKDRKMERFEFKKVKKIVSANARITAFIKKINEIVIKFQEGKTGFLKNLVEQYSRFKQNFEDNTMQPRRLFISYCGCCRKKVEYLTLPSYEQVNQCLKCKVKVFSEELE